MGRKNQVEAVAEVLEPVAEVVSEPIVTEPVSEPTTTSEPTFDKDQYIKESGSVSAAIRKLSAEGKTRGQIAKLLDKRYQHVRNVLVTPVKKNG